MDAMIKLPVVGKCLHHDKIWEHKGRTCIRQIFVSYDSGGVRALQFQYVQKKNDSKGRWLSSSCVLSEVLGRIGMTDFQTVQLDYPREHLTSVTIYKSRDRYIGVGGITFTTNTGMVHGPFPPSAAVSPVHYHLGDDNFGGFHGAANASALASIGVYLRPNVFKLPVED